MVKELEIERNIKFLGFKKNVTEYMQNASIFIISSRFEGLSLVALEALECGLPIVGFDLPSLREINGNIGCIKFTKNNTIDELEKEIRMLIKNDRNRQFMREKAKQRSKFYHIDNIGNMWTDYIEGMLTKKKGK